jgi:nucleoid DNA-binding protein
MNKSDFITAYAKKNNITKKKAEILLNNFFNLMEETLNIEKKVVFKGFGSFEKIYRQGRTVVIPKTEKRVKSKGKFSVRYTPGKTIINHMN